jgi:hypothetical protein
MHRTVHLQGTKYSTPTAPRNVHVSWWRHLTERQGHNTKHARSRQCVKDSMDRMQAMHPLAVLLVAVTLDTTIDVLSITPPELLTSAWMPPPDHGHPTKHRFAQIKQQ